MMSMFSMFQFSDADDANFYDSWHNQTAFSHARQASGRGVASRGSGTRSWFAGVYGEKKSGTLPCLSEGPCRWRVRFLTWKRTYTRAQDLIKTQMPRRQPRYAA